MTERHGFTHLVCEDCWADLNGPAWTEANRTGSCCCCGRKTEKVFLMRGAAGEDFPCCPDLGVKTV